MSYAATTQWMSAYGNKADIRGVFGKMITWAGETANFKFRVHPHMLRHACGYALANKGHDTRALQALPRPQEHRMVRFQRQR